ncbi:MAG: cytochrome c biogenesis protein CcdC [Gemmatimonadetes bacterium]|nr:cytochrome c biogenesis protein CcdC [Gemmatimonadota bacterium]
MGGLRLLFALVPLAGGIAVMAWRFQETRTPVTASKILIPPLAMSTGFLMFVAPAARLPWLWAAVAFFLGAGILYYPLYVTSSLERRGETIHMRRSGWFIAILLGLLGVRLALHEYVGQILSVPQTGGAFFVLAFGMIVRWRAEMYLRYRGLVRIGLGDPAA